MRFPSPIHAIVGMIALACTPPAVVELAAQELPQCFVESKPCGDPESLYRQIRECLNDPYLCHRPKNGTGFAVHSGDTRTHPALPSSLRSRVPLPSPAERITQTRTFGPPRYRTGDVAVRSDNTGTVPAEGASRAVDDLARDLPLDPAIRNLGDALPDHAGAIELRLGLRRTNVAGIDMRGRTPSSAEIVEALAPRESSAQ
jgi:hypothetical protein